MDVQISSLHIYPLKSAQGLSVPSLDIIETGPRWDREWMVVNESGLFLTQRTHRQLGRLKPELTNDSLIVHAPEQEPLHLKFEERNESTRTVKIFGKPVLAEDVGSYADQWMSDYLGQSVHLVRSPARPERKTSGNHGPISPIMFADGYPFLLTNQATLDELNRQLPSPVSMDRFRPNIVIQGAPCDTEDRWEKFTINDIPFLSVKACQRCVVIELDPQTGERNKDISKVLKSYRSKEGQILFGQNLTHQGSGTIHVGDKLLQ